MVNRYFMHVKTGDIYRVVGFCVLEKTWAKAVLYERELATSCDVPIARDLAEFCDGRFRRVYANEKRRAA
jgi:hypothetical protein